MHAGNSKMYNFSKFSIKSQSFLFCSSLISATCHPTRWRCDVECVRPIQGEHSPSRKRQTVSKSAHSGSLASTESGGEAELTDICSALHMIRAYLQRATAANDAKIAACGTEGSA